MNEQIKSEIVQAIKDHLDNEKRSKKLMQAYMDSVHDRDPEEKIQERLHEFDAAFRAGDESSVKLDEYRNRHTNEFVIATIEVMAEKTKDVLEKIDKDKEDK